MAIHRGGVDKNRTQVIDYRKLIKIKTIFKLLTMK